MAESVGVCFLRDYNCIYVLGDTPYSFNSFSMTHPASLSMPTYLDVEADTVCAKDNNGGFSSKCWNGYELLAGSYQYFTYRYMPLSDDNRYNTGDSEIVWSVTFDASTDNKQNLAFIFAGATQLWTLSVASLAAIATLTF